MTFMRTWVPGMAILGLALLTLPFISHSGSHLDLSRLIGIHALLAISVGLCYGQAGILSLGQASFAAIAAYATAIATTRYELPIWVGLILALTLPPLFAYPLARIIVRLSPLALALSTLIMSELIHFGLTRGGEFTGGYIGLPGIPTPAWLESRIMVHIVIWSLIALAVTLLGNLRRSSEGAALRAIATDEVLAHSQGIKVSATLSLVFAVAASIAGLAGFLYAHTSRYLSPESLSLEMSIAAVAMVVIGGRFSAVGPVVGAVVVVLLLEVLPAEELSGIFYGGLLVVALILFPSGVAGVAERITWSRRDRGDAVTAAELRKST